MEENGPGLENVYNGKAERVYLHNGVDEYVSIRNLEMDSGPKILLLRDSYATPVGAFLAQSFHRLICYGRFQTDEEKLSKFLEENHYDYVLLALYPENLSGQAFPLEWRINHEIFKTHIVSWQYSRHCRTGRCGFSDDTEEKLRGRESAPTALFT